MSEIIKDLLDPRYCGQEGLRRRAGVEIEELRGVVRVLAPTGTPEAVTVRKMLTFEQAEAIYASHQQSTPRKRTHFETDGCNPPEWTGPTGE